MPAGVADPHASSANVAPSYPVSGFSATPLQAIGSTVAPGGWEANLEAEALALLVSGQTDVWDVLTRRFESKLIQTALVNTRGRRIEAAQKLGIGRNTITRKIQELGLE
jgi:two-component system nitrogen regulation response regulator GlnG